MLLLFVARLKVLEGGRMERVYFPVRDVVDLCVYDIGMFQRYLDRVAVTVWCCLADKKKEFV